MFRLTIFFALLLNLYSCWPDHREQQEIEAEAIEFYKSEENYLRNLKLCKSDSFEDTVIITNDFYINLNSTFLSKKSIVAAHFISNEHLQISILSQANEGKWKSIFTRKLELKRENYSINLFNSIKTERFKNSRLVLIPEGIWRNYYNYVITIDSHDKIRLNTEMIANEEFDIKTNSVFSIHSGGSNKITATEFQLINNQLKPTYNYEISRDYNNNNGTFSNVFVNISKEPFINKSVVLKNHSDNWNALYIIKLAKNKAGI